MFNESTTRLLHCHAILKAAGRSPEVVCSLLRLVGFFAHANYLLVWSTIQISVLLELSIRKCELYNLPREALVKIECLWHSDDERLKSFDDLRHAVLLNVA